MRIGHLRDVNIGPEQVMMTIFTLARIRKLNGDEDARRFRRDLETFVRTNPLDAWLRAWSCNERGFLNTLAWDQDHDYGEGLIVHGAMGARGAGGGVTRGLSNAARLREAGVDLPSIVQGRKCCVVGSWCGYEVLLLYGMAAAEVGAIEEVPTFAEWTGRQRKCFGVPGPRIHACSLYDLPEEVLAEVPGCYDVIYCPGVLYHCSDPACAIAILRLLLRPGGVLLFETMALPDGNAVGLVAQYRGPSVVGWNWWMPSGACWVQMARDVGFPDARQVDLVDGRAWIVGTASPATPLLIASGAAGFARTDILDIMRRKLG